MPSFDFSTATADNDLARGRLLLRYLRETGYSVLYAAEDKTFYVSNGGPWVARGEDSMRKVAHELHDGIDLVVETKRRDALANWDGRETRPEPATALERTATAFASTRLISNALHEARVQPGVGVSLDAFDADPDLLGVKNGVVNLRTGELRPYTAEDRITRVVPVDYDPAAEAPTWLKFLDETFVDDAGRTDPALVDFMRRLIGYGITGHTREQRLPIFVGEGGTGKGTFVNTLAELFAAHTEEAAFESFEARGKGAATDDLASLHGARLVLASEGTEDAPMAEAVLKRVTGGDSITARHLYQRTFTYVPRFLLILTTNHLPSWAGNDDAIWRRVLLVQFKAKIPQRDGTLRDRLREEFPGILAWAVRGAVEWSEHGLDVPAAVSTATTEYREESHPLADWMADAVEVTSVYSDAVRRAACLASYKEWCKATDTTAVSDRSATKILAETEGITKALLDGIATMRGMRLLTPAERLARSQTR